MQELSLLSPIAEQTAETSLFWRTLQLLVGLSPRRSCWGHVAMDIACCLPAREKIEWYQYPRLKSHGSMRDLYGHSQVHDSHSEHDDFNWFTMVWHQVPHVRFLWGDAPVAVHTGAQELFIDLVFVGVAYQVGVVVKSAIYSCTPPAADIDGHGHGSHYTHGSITPHGSGAGRSLADDSHYAHGSGSGSGSGSGGGAAAHPECISLFHGLLHALAPFVAMYMLWSIETAYRGRFHIRSKLHRILDMLSSLCLIMTAMSSDSVQSHRGHPRSERVLSFFAPLLLGFVIWLSRLLELAFLSPREGARRQASAELVVGSQVLVAWVVALILVCLDFGSYAANESASDSSAALVWFGGLNWLWGQTARPLRELVLPGPHLPIERTCVSPNSVFYHHRNNEFMFLMLGETMLQIVIGSAATEHRGTLGEDARHGGVDLGSLGVSKLTGAMAFVIALCMMASFREIVSAQTASDEKISAELSKKGTHEWKQLLMLRKDTHSMKGVITRVAAANRLEFMHKGAIMREDGAERLVKKKLVFDGFTTILWGVKAIAVMLVGVSVKLAIYAPLAPVDAHHSLPLRLMIGVSLSIVFGIQLFYSVVFQNWHLYSIHTWRREKAHFVLLLLRLATLGCAIGLCFVPLLPYQSISLQAVISLVQCTLLHAHEHKYGVVGDEHAHMHRFAQLQSSLDALRLKASRNRTTGAHIRAAIRIQALSRGVVQRATVHRALIKLLNLRTSTAKQPLEASYASALMGPMSPSRRPSAAEVQDEEEQATAPRPAQPAASIKYQVGDDGSP